MFFNDVNKISLCFVSPFWSYDLVVNALEVPNSKPLGGSKIDSAFHSSEVDQISTRYFGNLLVKSKLFAPSGFVAFPTNNYMFKVNNRNTRPRCEICSKLTIKKQERRHWRRCGVFIVNFEHISNLVLVFLVLNLRG